MQWSSSAVKMFFLHEMERTITLHPTFLGPYVHEYLDARLKADVEGTNTGNFFIICVLDDLKYSDGRVLPSSGFAEYIVHYRAVVWRPFKGEALDGVVTSVLYNGFFVDVGPLSVFVSKQVSSVYVNCFSLPETLNSLPDDTIRYCV